MDRLILEILIRQQYTQCYRYNQILKPVHFAHYFDQRGARFELRSKHESCIMDQNLDIGRNRDLIGLQMEKLRLLKDGQKLRNRLMSKHAINKPISIWTTRIMKGFLMQV